MLPKIKPQNLPSNRRSRQCAGLVPRRTGGGKAESPLGSLGFAYLFSLAGPGATDSDAWDTDLQVPEAFSMFSRLTLKGPQHPELEDSNL